jgi:predicted N-acyltransferase
MDGDLCPLPELVRLKHEFNALLMVDEAHSFCVAGRTGRGVDEHFGLSAGAVDIWVGTLSKAIPSNGGFVAGSRELVVYLQHRSGPFVFSAALSPGSAAAALAALEVVASEPQRLARAQRNADRLRRGLCTLGYDTGRSETPIIPVMLGEDAVAHLFARRLRERGVLATPIVFPAVAAGQARLRLCAMASHSGTDIDQALGCFDELRGLTNPRACRQRPRTATKITTRLPAGIDVRCFDRIDQIDPNEWDAVVNPDDLQATHRFIRVCQGSGVEDARYRHLMAYEGGRLVGVASLTLLGVELDLLADRTVQRLSRHMRSLYPSFLKVPVLFGGLPVSFGRSCLQLTTGAAAHSVVPAMAEAMEGVADELGAKMLAFKEFTPAEARQVDHLQSRGYLRVPSLPSCELRIRWRSFDDYLAHMRAGYRRQVKASLGTARRRGLTIRRVADFRGDSRRLFELYTQVIDRAEHKLERLNLAFFEQLAAAPELRPRAIYAERDGELLAYAIMLQGATTSTFLIVGIDYKHNRDNLAYINIVNAVVAAAIDSGATSLEMGQTSYELKGRLGASVVPRYIYLKHRSKLVHSIFRVGAGALFPAHTLRERRVFREGR